MKHNVRSLLSTWVKDPELYDKCIVICSECLISNEDILNKILNMGDIVLTACPEKERDTYFGKIATIIKCSRPRKIVTVTRDGSPHCRVLHNAVLQAIFLTNSDLEFENFVVLENSLIRISKEAITLSRYLSVLEQILKEGDYKSLLMRLSIEYHSLTR